MQSYTPGKYKHEKIRSEVGTTLAKTNKFNRLLEKDEENLEVGKLRSPMERDEEELVLLEEDNCMKEQKNSQGDQMRSNRKCTNWKAIMDSGWYSPPSEVDRPGAHYMCIV